MSDIIPESWLPKPPEKRYVLKRIATPPAYFYNFQLDSTNYGKAVKEALRILGYTIEYVEETTNE